MRITLKLILVIIPVLLLFTTQAVAWGPATHTWITDELLNDPQGNEILELCSQNQVCRDAFMAGSEIPDITVVYYFEHGGQNYRATHNWNFQQEVMNQATNDHEKAFAYGIAQHLISDAIAHQVVIPMAITEKGIPNWLIHPLLEQKYDSLMKSKYPYLVEKTPHMFDAIIYGPYGDRYIEMVQNAIGNDAINVEDHVIKLAASLDSFYDPENGSFTPTGVGIFGLYPFICGICDIAEPLSTIAGTSAMDAARAKTIEENVNVFNNWGARYALSPHGFDALHDAEVEASVGWFSLGVGIYFLLIFVIPIVILYFTKNPVYAVVSFLVMVLGFLAWIAWMYLSI